jgi:hypothetical protein
MTTFIELNKLNVNDHTEKKGNLTYLSWTWAVEILLKHDPEATWEFPEPKVWNDTVMVFCNVTAFGKTMRMQLPVMDNRNNAITNPDTRKISDATMRCLAKCIACFGIGLYVYAGEDVPSVEAEPIDIDALIKPVMEAGDLQSMKNVYIENYKKCGDNAVAKKALERAKDIRKSQIEADIQRLGVAGAVEAMQEAKPMFLEPENKENK